MARGRLRSLIAVGAMATALAGCAGQNTPVETPAPPCDLICQFLTLMAAGNQPPGIALPPEPSSAIPPAPALQAPRAPPPAPAPRRSHAHAPLPPPRHVPATRPPAPHPRRAAKPKPRHASHQAVARRIDTVIVQGQARQAPVPQRPRIPDLKALLDTPSTLEIVIPGSPPIAEPWFRPSQSP